MGDVTENNGVGNSQAYPSSKTLKTIWQKLAEVSGCQGLGTRRNGEGQLMGMGFPLR